MSKAFKSVVAAIAVAAVPVIGAPAAMASDFSITAGVTTCPRDGNPGGGQRCTSIGNGALSVRGGSDNSYYTVNYYRHDGGSLTARNGVERNRTNRWASFRNMNKVPFHYEDSFSLGASCSSVTGKLNTSGGDTYPTPPLPRC